MRRLHLALCLAVLCSPAVAGENINLELRDADLADVIRMLAESTAQNVIIEPGGATARVTVSFKNIAAEEALAALLKTYGYAAVQEGNILRIVRTVQPEQAPAPVALERRSFTIQAVPPATLQEQVVKLLSSEGTVVASPAAKTLVVVDRPEKLQAVQEFLELVDTRPRQVMIEARILEVGLDDRDQMGFEWDWIYTRRGDGTNLEGRGTQDLLPAAAEDFRVAILSRRIDAALEALATRGYVNLLSSPKVAVIDGETAKVEVIEEVPYIQATVSIAAEAAGGSTTTSEQVEFKEVGVKLEVQPQIGGDGRVLMKIVPEVSEAPTRFEGIPVVNRRKTETQVIVADGQMIAIGGLIRENQVEDVRRVPFLSRIPLIGIAFRSTDFRTIKTELLILIQPTILTDDVAMSLTEQLQSRSRERTETFRDKPLWPWSRKRNADQAAERTR
jgi:type II secretory pathway component GspD/PulD (secretin)